MVEGGRPLSDLELIGARGEIVAYDPAIHDANEDCIVGSKVVVAAPGAIRKMPGRPQVLIVKGRSEEPMNQDTAALVLTNLRERAENSNSPVVLTSVEIRALQVLFGEAAADSASHRSGSDAELQGTEPSRISPEQPLRWKPDKAPRTDLILCLDFGTSFSKASACKTHDSNDVPDLINIGFGE